MCRLAALNACYVVSGNFLETQKFEVGRTKIIHHISYIMQLNKHIKIYEFNSPNLDSLLRIKYDIGPP